MLEPMPTAESDRNAARRQLDRVLASAGFSRNERLARFLRFVVEQHLDGKDGEIKESVLAIEVFGRGPDHDPRQDSIVRTEAARLRARLDKYYVGDGKNDELVIELPKGGYAPVFRQPAVELATSSLGPGTNSPPPGKRPWLLVALAGIALAVGALAWWWSQRPNAPISIAVLPLTNLSQDPANEYFADGLTDEIIRNLSIIDGLAVRSQTSSFVFKGTPRNVREAGKLLEADYILEGSVLRAGQQLRINAQLVRVRDDFPLWSGRYDRELPDVLAIQDEISRGIVNSLRLKLERGRRRYETSAEAYDLYLRARAQTEDKTGLGGLARSIPFFEQTIVKDPSFAPAYAGLAVAYAGLSGMDRFNADQRSELISKMRVAAEKAIELDPLSAEAHRALGLMYARDAQWEHSEKSFRRSLQLDPNSSGTRVDLIIYLLLPFSKLDQAVAEARMADKADPLGRQVQSIVMRALFSAGRIDEGIAHCPKPCAEALVIQGKTEAIPILEEQYNGRLAAAGSGLLGRAYALAGRRAEAEKIATVQWRPIEQAGIFTALGDKDRAFEALERAIPLGPVRLGRDLTYPEFAPLRGDPRVKALRKKVGLPE
jgi:TolB-like protein